MSVEYLTKVWKDKTITNKMDLIVMLALADRADDEGFAFPGFDSLADKCRMTARGVIDIVARLKTTEKLSVDVGGSHHGTNLYQLYPPMNRVHGGEPGSREPDRRPRSPDTSLYVSGTLKEEVLHQKPTEQAEFAATDDSATIEEIYQAYPRKVGKTEALKAIRNAIKRSKLCPSALLEKVQLYAKSFIGDRQYMPHPSTWFNRGSYDDDPKEWIRRNGNGPSTRDLVEAKKLLDEEIAYLEPAMQEEHNRTKFPEKLERLKKARLERAALSARIQQSVQPTT